MLDLSTFVTTESSFAPLHPDTTSRLIDAATSELFGASLLGAAQTVAPVVELFAYSVAQGARPVPLLSVGQPQSLAERARMYSLLFYQWDPLLLSIQKTRAPTFAYCVDADDIGVDQYRRTCFDSPHFRRKASFGWRDTSSLTVMSFYVSEPEARNELDRFVAFASVGLLALRRFVAARNSQSVTLAKRLEAALATAYPELTSRERQICAATLAGESAHEIGSELGIGRSTVLTYRQRAYARLGVSSANALLDRLSA